MTDRGGFTLIELMVVVAVMALSYVVASVSLASAFRPTPPLDNWDRRLADARRRAVEEGIPTVAMPDSANARAPVLFLPDGRAVGPNMDPLTGDRIEP